MDPNLIRRPQQRHMFGHIGRSEVPSGDKVLCLAGQPGIQSAEQGRGVRDKLEAVHGYVHTLGLFRCTFLKQKRALGVKGLARFEAR